MKNKREVETTKLYLTQERERERGIGYGISKTESQAPYLYTQICTKKKKNQRNLRYVQSTRSTINGALQKRPNNDS